MKYLIISHLGSAKRLLQLEPVMEALYYKHRPDRLILQTSRAQKDLLAKHPLVTQVVADKIPPFTGGLGVSGRVTKLEWTGPQELGSFSFVKDDIAFCYDFTDVQSELLENVSLSPTECYANRAEVKLLRKTPSFGNYSHVVDSKGSRVLVGQSFERDILLFRETRALLGDAAGAWASEIWLPPGVEDETETVEQIKRANVYICHEDGPGMEIAHAAGVREIIVITDGTLPFHPLPNVQTVQQVGTMSRHPELDLKVQAALRAPKYSQALNRGNACEWIKNYALQFCKGRGLDVGSNQDAWALPGAIASDEKTQKFDQGPFDYIFSSHCLEHVVEWQVYLKLWEESLRPGGTVFLYLPHPAMEYWRPEGEWVKGGWHVHSPEPVQLVKWLMENTSLKVQEYSVYPDSAWSFYIVARKDPYSS